MKLIESLKQCNKIGKLGIRMLEIQFQIDKITVPKILFFIKTLEFCTPKKSRLFQFQENQLKIYILRILKNTT